MQYSLYLYSQYFSDTYGENHIVFKTTETLGNYEKHVVVLKFDQCGVANRVKQRSVLMDG